MMPVALASSSSALMSERWRAILAISLGNALEWFDFVLYGYFAAAIARNFFPFGGQTASLLLTLAAFGAAFLMRPLGALIIGNYADRRGRKPALVLTIALMMAGTALVAFAPPYAWIGPAAPLLIICSRLLQGFSAGGEFGSATAFLAEQDPRRRGFYASMQIASQALAAVLGTLAGALLTGLLSADQVGAWAWRIPFFVGLLIGPVAFYIRRRVAESLEFQSSTTSSNPLRETVTDARDRLLISIGAVALFTVTTYTLIFMPTYAVSQLGLPLSVGFVGALITSILQVVLVPIAGAASDRWGRFVFTETAAVCILLAVYPLFAWVTAAPSAAGLLTLQVTLGALLAIHAGALSALLSELFPTRLRSTGLAASYALSVAIFGGFAPFIGAALVQATGSKVAPSFYVMLAAAITLVAVRRARRVVPSAPTLNP